MPVFGACVFDQMPVKPRAQLLQKHSRGLPHLRRLICMVALDTAGLFHPVCSLLISHIAAHPLCDIAPMHILQSHGLTS